jgi:hypothetical protein
MAVIGYGRRVFLGSYSPPSPPKNISTIRELTVAKFALSY